MNRGWLNKCVAKFRILAIAPLLALAVTICIGGVANAQRFSDRSLHGGYGCLSTFLDDPNLDDAVILDQLELNGRGAITFGSEFVNFNGEVCAVTVNPVGSSYAVTPNGTGTLTVHVLTAVEAADGDPLLAPFCTALSGSTLHYAIVVEAGGKMFNLAGLDPFFTGGGFTGTGDRGDGIVAGKCNRQVGS